MAAEDGAASELGRRTNEEFAVFYRDEHAEQVRRVTLLVGNRQTAQDLVHDAFAEILTRWHRLDDPGPYLQTAVLNRCRDHGRRQSVQRRALPLLLDSPSADDEQLWDAVQKLPFNHRAALVLKFHYRMTQTEIAVALGCRPGSVGTWIQRGLRKLRKDLS